jgi:hypothetical protein
MKTALPVKFATRGAYESTRDTAQPRVTQHRHTRCLAARFFGSRCDGFGTLHSIRVSRANFPAGRVGIASLATFVVCGIMFCTVVGAAVAATESSMGERYGIIDDRGAFLPKVEVLKDSGSVLVTKLDPAERFGSIEIRFVGDAVDPSFSPRNLCLQWEKPNGPGKLWPVAEQKTYDPRSKTYHGSWETSPSFRILDQSRGNVFRNHTWDRFLEISLDGKPLHGEKPVNLPAAHPMPTAFLSVEREAIPPQEPVQPEVLDRAPVRSQLIPDDSLTDQDRRYRDLVRRVEDLEVSLAAANARASWGMVLFPLIACIGVFGTAWLYFFSSQRRKREEAFPAIRYGEIKFRPELRVRNSG